MATKHCTVVDFTTWQRHDSLCVCLSVGHNHVVWYMYMLSHMFLAETCLVLCKFWYIYFLSWHSCGFHYQALHGCGFQYQALHSCGFCYQALHGCGIHYWTETCLSVCMSLCRTQLCSVRHVHAVSFCFLRHVSFCWMGHVSFCFLRHVLFCWLGHVSFFLDGTCLVFLDGTCLILWDETCLIFLFLLLRVAEISVHPLNMYNVILILNPLDGLFEYVPVVVKK